MTSARHAACIRCAHLATFPTLLGSGDIQRFALNVVSTVAASLTHRTTNPLAFRFIHKKAFMDKAARPVLRGNFWDSLAPASGPVDLWISDYLAIG